MKCLWFHKWKYWKGGIAIYRKCAKCNKWQFLARGLGSDEWFDCEEPDYKKLHYFEDAGWRE